MSLKFLITATIVAGTLFNIALTAQAKPSPAAKVEIQEVKQKSLTPKQQADRDAALTELGEIVYRNDQFQPANTIVPKAIPFLKHPDAEVRLTTVRLFQQLGRPTQDAIPYLIPLLQDSDLEVRSQVPFALAEMGDQAKDAIPQLKQMLNDPKTAFAASWALSFLDRDTRTTQLQKSFTELQSTDSKTRDDARFTLGLIRPRELKPQLTQLLKHKNPDIRQSAESILASLNVKNGTYIGRGLDDYLIVDGDRCRRNRGGALSPWQENCSLSQIDGDRLYDGDQEWTRVP
jgi:HEAT repeat protein